MSGESADESKAGSGSTTRERVVEKLCKETYMLKKLDHIGIAVESIEAALKFFRDALGLTLEKIEEVPGQKVRVAFLPIGETHIELIEPTSPDSPVKKFLSEKGEGIQHLAFETDDVQKALDDLKAKGVQVIDASPRAGAGGSRVAFLHPKSSHKVLIELCKH
jgi:methylmalonyl-CoA/ethylmalonyl-CoA epimerase